MRKGFELTVDGVVSRHSMLMLVYRQLDDLYESLDYGDMVHWELHDLDTGRYTVQDMACGIWQAMCEDERAMFMWLEALAWRYPDDDDDDDYPDC